MIEGLDWLFDAANFTTRDKCGDWSPGLVAVYRASNLVIALSYFLIPVFLVWLWVRFRGVLVSVWLTLALAVFVFLCGCTHVMDYLAFSWPAYRFFTAVNVATATASLATALGMPGALRRLMCLRTPDELEAVNNKLQEETRRGREARAKLEETNSELLRRTEILEQELRTVAWRHSLYDQIDGIKERLADIRALTEPKQ